MSKMSKRTTMGSSLSSFGAGAWVLGTIQYFVIHLIVQSAWSRPYSWSLNNISDLSNIHCQPWGDNARYVCSPLHGLMSTSFVIEGALILVGAITIRFLWHRTFTARAARSLLVIAGMAWIIVGLTPADVNENLHVLGALLIMICGNVGLIFAGFVSRTRYTRWIGVLAIAMGVMGLIAMVLFFSGHYFGLGMGGMERCVIFPVQIWTFAVGCYLLLSSTTGNLQTEGESTVGIRLDQHHEVMRWW